MSTLAFHRPARAHPEMPPAEPVPVRLPPAAAPPQGKVVAWLTTLSPLVLTGGSMVFMLGYGGGGLLIRILMPVVMIVGIGMSAAVRVAQTHSEKKRKKVMHKRYLGYLEEQEVLLHDRAVKQMAAMERVHPDVDDLWRMAAERQNVWERRRDDTDFLEARIGRGAATLASAAVTEGHNDPFAEFEPELLDAATTLVQRYSTLEDAPVALPLRELGTLAVYGDPARSRAALRSLLCQVATLHSPDDVSIAVCHPPDLRGEWDWVKWLPHSRDRSPLATVNGSGPPCLIADSAASFTTLLAHVVRPRLDQLTSERRGAGLAEMGHLVLVMDGYRARSEISSMPLLRELLPLAAEALVTVICIPNGRADEPSHVDARLEVDAEGTAVFADASPNGRRIHDIHSDHCDVPTAEAIARALAPLRLEERKEGGGREFSENIRLLELLDIPSPTLVDPRVSWHQRRRDDVMRVPIGLRADGEPLLLDLKEAAAGGMGPHGLVIGATGSGKSELLRTLVTSLAINHGPDTLSFVFVDFKGGAAFADLSELPHVAGMITNLQGDLSRVDRMYAALIGEQERRQRLLRDAGNVDGIKEYQARRAHDPTMEPMPYLMIVVDEFGELLAARPDFLDLFIAIGRVGRSLGMHLLLATQRLEEGRLRGLEGHLRYRICLRTFSAQESQTVLGTADAYHLPSFPGVGYFKVDTTIYQRFKTALISGPHEAGRLTMTRRSPVAVFAGVAHAEGAGSAGGGAVGGGANLPTEMEVAIDRLNELGRDIATPVHQVWLPPLEPVVTLGSVIHAAGADISSVRPFGTLKVPLGMVDMPMQQAQEPFLLDFSGVGGHMAIVGAPQTGKSTLLRTLIASFGMTHSPEEIQFYCIDLGGGALHSLESLPHVGAVAGKLERDKLRRVVRQINSIIEEREILFRKHAIDSMPTFRRKRLAGELPASTLGDVFLVIDNWSQFKQEFDDADTEIGNLLATGLGYGIHVVIATGRWADMRPQLRDNIGCRLEFRLNDPLDSEMPKGAAKTLPPGVAGRGLTPQALHFQAALPRIDETAAGDQQQAVDAMVLALRRRWAEAQPAPPVRLLPLLVHLEELPDPAAPGAPAGVPIGIEEFRLEPVYMDLFSAEPHALVLGDSECGKTTLIRAWMHQLRRRYTSAEVNFVLVDYRRTLLDSATGDYISHYAATPNLVKGAVDTLRTTLTARLPPAEVTREELINRSWWSGPEYVVFVDDYDLVVSPTGNPLQPLVELLPQGRDVGFHLVIARRVGGVARSAFEAVFQRIRELGSPGLLMSGDPQEGQVLGTQRAAQLPPGRGYLVRRGQRTALVQTVRVDADNG